MVLEQSRSLGVGEIQLHEHAYPPLFGHACSYSDMQSPELLVRFFLVFLYGMPETVGWDPTMAYIEDSDPPQYYITVNNAAGDRQVYKTLGLESSVGAEVLRGCGTRVWRAVRCDPKTFKVSQKATEVALKDCWMDQSRELEGDVIGKLHALATARIQALMEQLDDLKNTGAPLKVTARLEQDLDAAVKLEASLLAPVIHGAVLLPGSAGKDCTLDRKTILKEKNGSKVTWEYIFHEKKYDKADGDPLSTLR